MGAKSDNFCLFSAYLGVFCPDLWMKYQIFISIVDISANLENIDIDKGRGQILLYGQNPQSSIWCRPLQVATLQAVNYTSRWKLQVETGFALALQPIWTEGYLRVCFCKKSAATGASSSPHILLKVKTATAVAAVRLVTQQQWSKTDLPIFMIT